MVTVEADVDRVERRLAAGELWCPSCGGVLAGWGRARPRQVRGPDGSVGLCPRRSRCTGCGVTHVLLPVSALLRRADTAAVIVSALAAKARVRAAGFGGSRPIWLARRRRCGAGCVASLSGPRRCGRCSRCGCVRWMPDPVMPDAAGGGFADAVTAIAALAAAIGRRFALPTVSLAETAVAVSGGRLLAPGWPGERVQHEPTLPR